MSTTDEMLFQAACFRSNADEADYDGALFRSSPFVVLKPRLYPDGDQWCALYGDNLQVGVCGFGYTPADAALAFNKAWKEQKP